MCVGGWWVCLCVVCVAVVVCSVCSVCGGGGVFCV